jgi:hypothetical protein
MPRVEKRPECELAHSYTASVCGDPQCGLHIVPARKDGSPICEIIVGREHCGDLVRFIRDNELDIP